jgi:inosose dehydratase
MTAQPVMGRPASSVKGRVAGAPISWGVCEVPDWGYQLPLDRVLADMRAVGLTATEFGPDGYLPTDPRQRSRLLAEYGLTAAGGFVPVVLHDPAVDVIAEVDRALDAFAGGHPVLVLAAATGRYGYDARPDLDADGWSTLLSNLDRAAARAAERGLMATLHPHVGTMVEKTDEVRRVLDGSAIALCLDTGHLLIGGTDPAELARAAARRIGHVHLKDVTASVARNVASGEISFTRGVASGLFRPLGQGDVDVAGVVAALEAADYRGWYVLEQDTMLAGPPADEGPVRAVRESLYYLRGLFGGQR